MTDPIPSHVRLLLAAGWQRHEPDDDDGEPLWSTPVLEPHHDPAARYSTDAAAKRQLRLMGWQTITVPLVQHGVWRQPRNGGTAPSFAVACDWACETIEQQLRDHGKSPGSHRDAASPPAPGADPLREPEPAEGEWWTHQELADLLGRMDAYLQRVQAAVECHIVAEATCYPQHHQQRARQLTGALLLLVGPEPAGGDVELPPIEQVLELLNEERLHNCDRTGLLDTLGWVRDWIELLNQQAAASAEGDELEPDWRRRASEHNARQGVVAAAQKWVDALAVASWHDDSEVCEAGAALVAAVKRYRGQR